MKVKSQKGQALVELALSLLLLLTIVFGVTEFGRAMYIKNTLTNAAREGARRAAVTPITPPQTQLDVSLLRSYVESCIPFDRTGIAIDITPVSPTHGVSTIQVVVSLPFRTLVPLIIPQLNNITLTGQASMLYE